jgi:prolyl-tRNA synthetase
MRFSRSLIPTLREAPADAANVSHALLSRGGFVRRVGAGIYEYLPLGLRVLHKVQSVIRREMDAAGALEILMPALLPAEYFKETGRWDLFGDTLMRLRDRKGSHYHLAPTHEEIVTDVARHHIKSYRDLPKILYQIQTKFRDEARPRGGLLRGREFTMKDAYSFDVDDAAAQASYDRMRVAYERIFDSLGLRYRMVQADSGAMGGSGSAEFQVLVTSGEDAILTCTRCDYAANVEAACAREPAAPALAPSAAVAKIHTPGKGGIDDVVTFLGATSDRMLKSLVYTATDGPLAGSPFMCVVRGDHAINELKLARAVSASEVALADERAVEEATGAKVGYAGPVGSRLKVLVDRAAKVVENGITGANETDFHLTGVSYGRDYEGELVDVRLVVAGDACPRCEDGMLEGYRGIEAGHIFVLGTRYSEQMGATYLSESGERRPLVMGCYGIGVSRLIAAVIEQHNDADGILWPAAIAPYLVYLVTLGSDAAVIETATKLTGELEKRGIDVLWDDRDERPGVKFKDADLLGIPVRVVIGSKGLAAGVIELKRRSERDPAQVKKVPVDQAGTMLAEMLAAE